MKNSCFIYVLAMALVAPPAYSKTAKADSGRKNQYLQGTILQVQRRETDSASNYVGDNPSDASLRPEVYAYDISIRVNCATYVGRWNSAFYDIPSVFTPNRTVQVRLEKHLMYVDVPGEKEFRIGFAEHPRGPTPRCDH